MEEGIQKELAGDAAVHREGSIGAEVKILDAL